MYCHFQSYEKQAFSKNKSYWDQPIKNHLKTQSPLISYLLSCNVLRSFEIFIFHEIKILVFACLSSFSQIIDVMEGIVKHPIQYPLRSPTILLRSYHNLHHPIPQFLTDLHWTISQKLWLLDYFPVWKIWSLISKFDPLYPTISLASFR